MDRILRHRPCWILLAGMLGLPTAAPAGALEEGLPVRAEVRLAKSEVLVGEPVVLDLFLINEGASSVRVPARLDWVRIQAQVTSADGQTRIVEIVSPAMRSRSVRPDMDLPPQLASARKVVLDVDPENDAPVIGEAGAYDIQLIVGPGYESNKVQLIAAQPQGRNAEALAALLASRGALRELPVDTPEERYAWLDSRDREDRAFIQRFGDTAYGDYLRLELASNLMIEYSHQREPNLAEAEVLLGAIKDGAASFPLRDRALEILIEQSRKTGQIDEVNRLRLELLADNAESPVIFTLTGTPMRLVAEQVEPARAMTNQEAPAGANVKRFTR